MSSALASSASPSFRLPFVFRVKPGTMPVRDLLIWAEEERDALLHEAATGQDRLQRNGAAPKKIVARDLVGVIQVRPAKFGARHALLRRVEDELLLERWITSLVHGACLQSDALHADAFCVVGSNFDVRIGRAARVRSEQALGPVNRERNPATAFAEIHSAVLVRQRGAAERGQRDAVLAEIDGPLGPRRSGRRLRIGGDQQGGVLPEVAGQAKVDVLVPERIVAALHRQHDGRWELKVLVQIRASFQPVVAEDNLQDQERLRAANVQPRCCAPGLDGLDLTEGVPERGVLHTKRKLVGRHGPRRIRNTDRVHLRQVKDLVLADRGGLDPRSAPLPAELQVGICPDLRLATPPRLHEALHAAQPLHLGQIEQRAPPRAGRGEARALQGGLLTSVSAEQAEAGPHLQVRESALAHDEVERVPQPKVHHVVRKRVVRASERIPYAAIFQAFQLCVVRQEAAKAIAVSHRSRPRAHQKQRRLQSWIARLRDVVDLHRRRHRHDRPFLVRPIPQDRGPGGHSRAQPTQDLGAAARDSRNALVRLHLHRLEVSHLRIGIDNGGSTGGHVHVSRVRLHVPLRVEAFS
eukprot:scaffold240_cov243-Pinguiococcus_pyrenoidosus.AAC.21